MNLTEHWDTKEPLEKGTKLLWIKFRSVKKWVWKIMNFSDNTDMNNKKSDENDISCVALVLSDDVSVTPKSISFSEASYSCLSTTDLWNSFKDDLLCKLLANKAPSHKNWSKNKNKSKSLNPWKILSSNTACSTSKKHSSLD